MRIDFNVLWVDDQPDRVDAQIDAIRRRMAEQGFSLHARPCGTIEEARAAIGDQVFTDEIDLILVDWDLGGGVRGQDAIAEIRGNLPYKDVVFYSAQTAPTELRRMAFDLALEGVYCASREDLVEEVVGVFESLVKKVLDLDHTRGIVMGATSDMDHMVIECLGLIHDQSDGPGRSALIREALGYVEEHITTNTKKAQALAGTNSLADIFAEHGLLTANDRLRMLAGALKTEQMANHKRFRPAVVSYLENVVPGRNILGHVIPSRTGKATTVVDAKGKELTVEDTRDLRRTILELRSAFRNLLAALQPPGSGTAEGARTAAAK